ncbi:SpvB/TcaC N-terminal domain-containing protein [Chitinophaga sp. S165]|uniref:SpvB/TcaC N-terminal domain-containing protein n=1 Tax=Chitinophaga sp. S165 TaxID=2135462 RepID=UPI000D70D234|nr:SpvB/TcaC N-terminal domain-containing protein [Chitinophaga sp. S165]PWV56385.1 RHS repeat-associated protein [Chitinophaga sp. S165]
MFEDINKRNSSVPSSQNTNNEPVNTALEKPQQSGTSQSIQLQIPQVNLPKGGGALKSIDEKFEVNGANGTASFSIPIPFSPARNGFVPTMGLSYNSGSGNTVFGLGWTCDVPAIQRRTDKQLPTYTDEDIFIFSGMEDLVPELEYNVDKWEPKITVIGDYTIKTFRPRTEGSFSRIEQISHPDKGMYWKVTTRNNITTIFGRSSNNRLTHPHHPEKVFKWLAEFSFDCMGNWIIYEYEAENRDNVPNATHEKNRLAPAIQPFSNSYLKRVKYANRVPYYINPADVYDPQPPDDERHFFELVFDYGEHDTDTPRPAPDTTWPCRDDPFSDHRAGFEVRTYRLCRRFLIFHYFEELGNDACLVRSLDLTHKGSSINNSGQHELTYLSAVNQSGYIRNNNTYSKRSFPPLEFEYQELQWNKSIRTVSPESTVHMPAGISSAYQWVDLYNEGISGILSEQGNGWYYKSNLGDVDEAKEVKFSHASPVIPKPSFLGIQAGTLTIQDLDGNGSKQVVVNSEGLQGYFSLSDDQEWLPFRPFEQRANIRPKDPNIRLFDVDGDGLPDIVMSEDNVFSWFPSKGTRGYDARRNAFKPFDEEQGAAIVFSDPLQSIFLSDMTGDGLTDIVRVRNGEVCYWPNTGFGNFGAKVTMSNAPVFDHPDNFNSSLLQLADVSGTGVSDIIYLGRNSFRAFLNLSGNAWSDAHEIDPFFRISKPGQLAVIDLLGTGTACIVWSSDLPGDSLAPMQYIDLMDSKKPHLLTRYKNNLGKETSVSYKSSTWFYLKDKQEGTPWITRLPFPVHVVHKTLLEDKISNSKFSSEYRYHHGYYDHAEREFRGFGKVEQIDSDFFATWQKNNAGTQLEPSETLFQQPVLTRTWYHTGAFIGREKILSQYELEYWYNILEQKGFPVATTEPSLPDALITIAGNLAPQVTALSTEEYREALRICKGMMLRQEVFSLDTPLLNPTDDEIRRGLTPFYTATHNCHIKLLQPRAQNKNAVFTVTESEALTIQYERNPSDPRMSHTLNTVVDDFGLVLEKAAVVYPRQEDDATLPAEVIAAQNKTFICYNQFTFTNDITTPLIYRLRLPATSRSYELTGISKTGTLYRLSDFNNVLAAATTPIAYEQTAGAIPTRRLIEDQCTTYLDDTLTTELTVGQQGAVGLKYQQYQLAFTSSLLQHIFAPKISPAEENTLMTSGHYVQRAGHPGWWVSSGIIYNVLSGETIADAKARFYAPLLYTDPTGAPTTVSYYKDYFLLIQSTEDPLQNSTHVDAFNFRTLQPAIVRDSNDNITQTLYDELGLLKAVAFLGKDLNNDGIAELDISDDLSGITELTLPAEQSAITTFFSTEDSVALMTAAANLLQHATIRYVYDYDKYRTNGAPVAVSTITRSVHHADVSPDNPLQIFIAFEYTGGAGQPVMAKMQATPGIATKVVVNSDNTYTVTQVDTSAQNPQRLRWIGNGRVVLNNKGKPVKQYEPYFSATPFYEAQPELIETGVSPIVYYDPLGRMVRTVLPEETFTRTVFTPWKRMVYDVNDNVTLSNWYLKRINNEIDAELIAAGKDPAREKEAAQQTAAHDDTPFTMHLDPLNRDIFSVEHNVADGSDEFYNTFTIMDIEGNIHSITDPRNNVVMRYRYNMLGQAGYQQSMDAGERWALSNVTGKPIKTWDSRNHTFLFTYDALQRPLDSRVTGGDGPVPLNNVFSRTSYGEAAADNKQHNLRGRVHIAYDSAGKLESVDYDAKGNLILYNRRLTTDYKELVNWSVPNPDTLLEADTYLTGATYDAIARITRNSFPDGSMLEPRYNEMSLLREIRVNGTLFVKNIDYNEKGQRKRIVYGNDLNTRYSYDKFTFRLNRLETTRNNNDPLQDNYYTYDPSGNITHIADKNIPVVFFNNQKIEGVSNYRYDAVYRLIGTSGREHSATAGFDPSDNFNDFPFLQEYSQGNALGWRNYTQDYQYDFAGNLKQVKHTAAGGDWTRDYTIDGASNRLLSTTTGGPAFAYPHHPTHGYITGMPHLTFMQWNFKDQLQAVSRQAVNAGTPETTWYVYDGAGQRIRKITERQAAEGVTPLRKSQRIYLGAVELFEEYDNANNPVLQRNTLHILDDTRRIALIETRVSGNDDGLQQLVRYQFDNHQGSACIETDQDARVISYEEYHPFGTTSYQAIDKDIKAAYKRYRYTGMERDEESGFQYHSARYYVPWLGRWLSADPIGIGDGLNVYRYARNNPLMYADTSGTCCSDSVAIETNEKKTKEKKEKEELTEAAVSTLTGNAPGGSSKGGGGFGGSSKGGDGPSGKSGDAGGSIGDSILNGLKGLGKWIGEGLSKLWDWIKGAASTVWNWIKGAASAAWDWIKGAATTIWEGIKGAASAAWDWIKGAAATAWNWIKETASAVWEWTKQKATEFWNWFAGDDGFLEDFLEVVGHLTWGLPATAAGFLFSLVNFTIGNIVVAIHNAIEPANNQWEYASISIGGPNNENDIIGNYGGLLNLGGLQEAVTLGPFVFFQGSGAAATSAGATGIQDYYANHENVQPIYLSATPLRVADHEEGHEDQNLLYGPFTLLLGFIFSLIPNWLKKQHSTGWFWYDRQANKWSGGNSIANPNPNVHP